MLVRRVKGEDIGQIQSWFSKRGLPCPPKWVFSSSGFIVPSVACGFIYFSNSGIATIDSYVSNPDADKKDTDQALDLVTSRIIKTAEKRRIKMICFRTKIKSIEKRAIRFGFKDNGTHISMSKELYG